LPIGEPTSLSFLAEADELEAEYVIRAAQDRRLSGEAELLWAHMAQQAVVGTVTVEVAARGAKPARRADLLVRVAHITLQLPQREADDPGIWLEPLPVWAIWLHEEAERLKPYLALMGVVAWRLFWLTHINRQTPSAPCTTILAEHEWKALYTTTHRSRPFQRGLYHSLARMVMVNGYRRHVSDLASFRRYR
jgi:hypothetical protein